MIANRFFVIAVVTFFGIANAEVVKRGECPSNITVVPNFDIEKYMGFWHEYAKYPFSLQQSGKCNAAAYSLEVDGRVRVNNSMVNKETGLLEDFVGYATPIENGKLHVVLPVNSTYTASFNYWVLATDYTSYSVVYSCQQSPREYTTNVWILTRERDPPMKLLETPLEAMKRNKVRLEPLQSTVQYQCSDSP